MKTKIFGIFIGMLFIAAILFPISTAIKPVQIGLPPGTVDQKQELTPQIEWLEGGVAHYQEFVPTDELICAVDVYMGCWYSGSYPVTLSIEYQVGMSAMTLATLNASSFPQNQQGWVTFDVFDRCLSIGIPWNIVIRFDPGSEYGWSGANGNPYTNGESSVGKDWDFAFRTYVLPNNPPSIPTINGKSNGTAGDPYSYTFTSTDPEGDDISYFVKWGDGSPVDWTALQTSGVSYTDTHTWTAQGTYQIEAKAKDSYGCQSDWATLSVSMPKNKEINTPFLNFLEQHPYLFPLLRQLLRL